MKYYYNKCKKCDLKYSSYCPREYDWVCNIDPKKEKEEREGREEWISTDKTGTSQYGFYTCPYCDNLVYVEECLRLPVYYYCPHCGKRIKGGDE